VARRAGASDEDGVAAVVAALHPPGRSAALQLKGVWRRRAAAAAARPPAGGECGLGLDAQGRSEPGWSPAPCCRALAQSADSPGNNQISSALTLEETTAPIRLLFAVHPPCRWVALRGSLNGGRLILRLRPRTLARLQLVVMKACECRSPSAARKSGAHASMELRQRGERRTQAFCRDWANGSRYGAEVTPLKPVVRPAPEGTSRRAQPTASWPGLRPQRQRCEGVGHDPD